MLYPDTLRQMTEDYNLGYQQASPEEILKFTPQLLATYNSTAFGTKKSANEEEISKKEFFKVRYSLLEQLRVPIFPGDWTTDRFSSNLVFLHVG